MSELLLTRRRKQNLRISVLCAALLSVCVSAFLLTGCPGKKTGSAPAQTPVTLTVAAAASLKNVFEQELIPRFTEKSGIIIEGTYDSSGKLKTQIEQGLDAGIFVSASTKQVDELLEAGFIETDGIFPLLRNKLVLIQKRDAQPVINDFRALVNAPSVAIGDPRSVPAGQYAREALVKLGIWDKLETSTTLSLGTNVTEVLNWVAAASANAGIVYATDAASKPEVAVTAVLNDDLLDTPIVYPAAIIAKAGGKTGEKEGARAFISFLKTEEAAAIFEKYGFSPY